MAGVYARLLAKVPYLLCTYCIILLVPAGAFTSTMNITGSHEVGGNITITCSWTLSNKEILHHVGLRPLPAKPGVQNYYYYRFHRGVTWASPGILINVTTRRFFSETFNESNGRASVRLTNLQCEDEQNLSCFYEIGEQDAPNAYYNDTYFLIVTSTRESPVVTIEQTSLHLNKDYLFFYEKSTITVKCAADLGKPSYGHLEWRLYENDRPVYITKSDPRIQPKERDASRKGNLNCSEFVKQKLVLTPSSPYRDLTVACFVHNLHTVTRKRAFCKDTKADLCGLSQKIWTIPRPDVKSLLLGVAIAIVEFIAIIVLIVFIKRFLARSRPVKPEPPSPEAEESSEEETEQGESTEIQEETFTEEGKSSVT